VIKGADFNQMEEVGQDICYHMENLESIQSVQLDVPGPRPEDGERFRVLDEFGSSDPGGAEGLLPRD
jgi:hypothetical protein